MRYYVCMECGFEWESKVNYQGCPRCEVGNIYYEEETDDNKDERTQEDAQGKGQTIHTNDVRK